MYRYICVSNTTLSMADTVVLGLIREWMILRQGIVIAAMTTGLLWPRDLRNNDITNSNNEIIATHSISG